MPLRVQMPNGEFSGGGSPDSPLMVIHRPDDFAARVGDSGLIGFGESYMAGDWEASDLTAVLEVFASRVATLIPDFLQAATRPLHSEAALAVNGIRRRTRARTSPGTTTSRTRCSNCSSTAPMTYSSALFEDLSVGATPSWDVFAAAQHRKIDRLLDGAGVGPGSRVLEIGTGWGELAIRAAQRGATVRSVTLSVEQQELAAKRISAAGLADRVQVDLLDYRQVQGEYDAVVSVEMIEAVGHQYWGSYFQTIDALLAPGGRAAIQAITMPHDRMLATRNTYTWVHKYIFPGGFLPSVRAIEDVTERMTTLRVRERMSMGDHYAQTLRLWDERFSARTDEASALGFDAVFARMWHFYLCYSEAGFRSGYLDVQQIVLDRRNQR